VDGLVDLVLRLGLRDQTFLVVTFAIGVLLVGSLLFAAAIVLRRLLGRAYDRRRDRVERLLEPLILDVLASDAPDESVHAAVGPRNGGLFLAMLLRYARQLEGDELETVQRLAKPYLPAVARRTFAMLPEHRARAVRTLATLGFADHEDVLIQVLDDPVPFVALMAAQALAKGGGARHARAVLEHLDRFPGNAGMRSEMLASMGVEAFPELRARCLDLEAPAGTRAVAADAVSQLGIAEGADLAAELIKQFSTTSARAHGHEREIALSALRIVARVGRDEHLPLVRSLAAHEDSIVRALSLDVVGELGGEADVPFVLESVDDPSRVVALHACTALRSLGATSRLEELMESRSGTDLSELAAEILYA